ncbi:MAG: DUF2169 domain-containing protein [Polyangiaceae bacterium]|nr:DUF2169 domain-containing protein [Polyangiaceae bacterium]
MRIVKPQALSLITRPFEHGDKCFLVVTVFAYFPFSSPKSLLHESTLWLAAADALGETGVLDAGMAKVRAEVLVEGKAVTPNRVPATAARVRVQFDGPDGDKIDKELYVVGDRHWELGGASPAAPFTEMPVTFDRAFGGEGFAPNPVGRGFKPIEKDGKKLHPLPNIEDGKTLVGSAGDRPAPVGFAAMDIMSKERQRHVGTYDDKWLKTRFPGVAEDFHWEFWNTAPLDQRFKSFFQGDETFRVSGMHESGATLEGKLPGVATRVFIKHKRGDEEALREAPSYRIDTVHLFPNVACGVVTFRCVFEVDEDDASDVTCVLAGFEDPAAPKSVEHYRAVLEKRLDKKNGALAMLADGDLMPPWDAPKVPEQKWNDLAEILKTEGFVYDRVEANARANVEEMKERAIQEGVPRSIAEEKFKLPPREEPPEDPEQLLEYVTKMQAEADKMLVEQGEAMKRAEDEARATMEARGLDFDEVMEKSRAGGPPKLDMEKNLEQLRALGSGRSVDEEALARIAQAEEKLLEAYRRFTHFFPAAKKLDDTQNASVRADLATRLAARESLAGIDLTGADLAGMDLRGADLKNAMLEGANLEGTNFEGADLEGATLSRATLRGARLAKARLAGTNFGDADLGSADLGGDIDMSGACFYKSRAEGASLRGAKLGEVQFLEASLRGADLQGADLSKAIFVDANVEGAKLGGAVLKDTICVRLQASKADFAGAKLHGTTLVETRAHGASFEGADLTGARIVLDSDFSGAKFDRARFHRTCMRTTNFEGASFVKAEMPEVDLSECNLRGADFTLADLGQSLLMKADMTGATLREANLSMTIMQKAKVGGADLSDSVLFRSDLAKIEGDSKTKFTRADLRQARVVAKQTKPEAT